MPWTKAHGKLHWVIRCSLTIEGQSRLEPLHILHVHILTISFSSALMLTVPSLARPHLSWPATAFQKVHSAQP